MSDCYLELRDIYIYIHIDTNTDHFTPLALRVRCNKAVYGYMCAEKKKFYSIESVYL